MSAFWVIVSVLSIAGGGWIARPLWRRAAPDAPSTQASNTAVHRDQLAELEADLQAGSITRAQYDEACGELERRVILESDAPRHEATPHSSRTLAALLLVIIPVAALGMYSVMGNPKAIGVPKSSPSELSSMTPEHFAELANQLARKLEKDPSDPMGWMMLARAYKVLDRPQDALKALERGVQLKPNDPEMLTDFAEVAAVVQGGSFEGRPEQAIQQALKASPDHPKGLTMAGALAFEKKNYTVAINHWQRLHRLVKNDPELQKALLAGIAEASRLRTVASTPAQAITGRVRLDPALADKVDPVDTVFVFARAAKGPGMPVAALRKQVRDLPFSFRLDDTFAVNPTARLGNLPEIVVGARISKSGDATPHAGDLQGYSGSVKLGAGNVVITIADVVQ